MPGAGEAAHVDPGFRGIAVHAGDALQVGRVGGIRRDGLADPPVEPRDEALEVLNMGEHFLQQEGLASADPAPEGLGQAGALLTQRPLGELGQHGDVAFPSRTSVFRPGTALICWAFTKMTSHWLSRILNTGFQNPPRCSPSPRD
jgi:hypothetical protein